MDITSVSQNCNENGFIPSCSENSPQTNDIMNPKEHFVNEPISENKGGQKDSIDTQIDSIIDPSNFLNEPINNNQEAIEKQDAAQPIKQIHEFSMDIPSLNQNCNENNSVPNCPENIPQINHMINLKENLLNEPMTVNQETQDAFKLLGNQNKSNPGTPESISKIDPIIDPTNFLNETTNDNQITIHQQEASQPLKNTIDDSLCQSPMENITFEHIDFKENSLDQLMIDESMVFQKQWAFDPLMEEDDDDSFSEAPIKNNVVISDIEMEENMICNNEPPFDKSMFRNDAMAPVKEEGDSPEFSIFPANACDSLSQPSFDNNPNIDVKKEENEMHSSTDNMSDSSECPQKNITISKEEINVESITEDSHYFTEDFHHLTEDSHNLPKTENIIDNSSADDTFNDQTYVPQFKLINCTTCNFTTDSRRLFDLHVEECDLELRHNQLLKEMLSGIKQICYFCPFESDNFEVIKGHHDQHSNQGEVATFQCENCSYSTENRYQLIAHSLTHNNKFKCDQCTYFTADKTNLTRHTLHHNSKSPCVIATCKSCLYQTSDMGAWEEHLLAHALTGQAVNISCRACLWTGLVPAAYDQRPVMDHQRRTNHRGFIAEICTFRCIVQSCSFAAHFKWDYLKHVKLKHADFECNRCDFVAAAESNLLVHFQTAHKMQSKNEESSTVENKNDKPSEVSSLHQKQHLTKDHSLSSSSENQISLRQHKIQSKNEASSSKEIKNDKPSETSLPHDTQCLSHDHCLNTASENQFSIHTTIQSKNEESSNVGSKKNKSSGDSLSPLSREVQNLTDDKTSFEVESQQTLNVATCSQISEVSSTSINQFSEIQDLIDDEASFGAELQQNESQTEKLANFLQISKACLNLKRKSDLALDTTQSKISKTGLESGQLKASESLPYKCFFCPFGSYSKKHVDDHEQQDHKLFGGLFACSDCNYTTPKRCDLREHRVVAHKNHIFCSHCQFKTINKSKFIRHVNAHQRANVKLFSCPVCDKYFISYGSFQRHKLAHEDIILLCDKCIFTVETVDDLLNHKYEAHGLKTFMCLACDFSTTVKSRFGDHVGSHRLLDNAVVFTCSVCKINFSVLGELIAHRNKQNCVDAQQNKKSGFSSPRYVTMDVLLYACRFCTFSSALVNEFNEHKQLHGSYVCVGCYFFTNNKQNYDRHVLMHKENNESTCSIDFRDFELREDVTYNKLLAIIGVVSYGCTECGFQTTHLVKLTLHKKAHKFITYACSGCSFNTIIKSEFCQHLVKHYNKEDVVTFKCLNYCGCVDLDNTCNQSINNLKSFKRHQMKARHATHLITISIQSKQQATDPGEQSTSSQLNIYVITTQNPLQKNCEENISYNLNTNNTEELTALHRQMNFNENVNNSDSSFKNPKKKKSSRSDRSEFKQLASNQESTNKTYDVVNISSDELNLDSEDPNNSPSTRTKKLISYSKDPIIDILPESDKADAPNKDYDVVNTTSDELNLDSKDPIIDILPQSDKADAPKVLTSNQNDSALNYEFSKSSNNTVTIMSNDFDSHFKNISDSTAFKKLALNQNELVINHEIIKDLKDTVVTLDSDSNLKDILSQSDTAVVTDSLATQNQLVVKEEIKTCKDPIDITLNNLNSRSECSNQDILEIPDKQTRQLNIATLKEFSKDNTTVSLLNSDASDDKTTIYMDPVNENFEYVDVDMPLDLDLRNLDVKCRDPLEKPIKEYGNKKGLYDDCSNSQGPVKIISNSEEPINHSEPVVVVYKCLICNLEISDKQIFVTHVLKHKADNHPLIYKCSNELCNFACNSLHNLKRHVSVCNQFSSNLLLLVVRLLKCQFCHYETHEAAKYDAHKNLHTSLVPIKRLSVFDWENINRSFTYRCIICHLNIFDEKEFHEHFLKHISKKFSLVYKCSNVLCDFECNSLKMLKEHVKRTPYHLFSNVLNLDVQLIKCQFCRYKTFEIAKLDAHKYFHCSVVSIDCLNMSNVEQLKQKSVFNKNNLLLKCKICSYEADLEDQISHHIFNHLKDISPPEKIVHLKLKCLNCKIEFSNVNSFYKHNQENTSHTDVAVEIMTFGYTCVTSTFNLYTATNYECKSCAFKTKQDNALLDHITFHKYELENVILACSCGSTFLSLIEFTTHKIETKHSSLLIRPTTYECGICHLPINSKKSFKNHIIFHRFSSKVQFFCKGCDKSSSDLDEFLKNHVLSKTCETIVMRLDNSSKADSDQNVESKVSKSKSESIKYRCRICAFNTTQVRSFDLHIEFHVLQNERVVLACACGVKYLNLNELERHQKESDHTSFALKLFTYKCVVCHYVESSKKTFQNHLNSHKINSPTLTFVCSACEKSSVDLDELLEMHKKTILCSVILAKIVDQNQIENTKSLTTQESFTTVSNASNEYIKYECKRCAFNTTEDKSFNDHLVYHVLQNERVVLACSCGIKYLNLNELKSHQTKSGHFSFALKLFSYKCVLCNFQEWSKKSFQNHVNFHKINSQTVTFVCSTCEKSSVNLDDLLKMHNKSILCELILAKIVDQNQMENTTNITTQESLITINNDSNKMTQNVVKAKPITYECKSCAFNTTEDRSFNDHLVYHVLQNERVVLVCSCGIKYLNLIELESHQIESGHFSIALKLFSYKCVLCNLQEWSKKSFQNHINFHKSNSQTVTFVCSTCEKSSVDLDDLLKMHNKSILCEVILAKIVDLNQMENTTNITTQESLITINNDSNKMTQNAVKAKPIRYECKNCAFDTAEDRSFKDHLVYHVLQNERVVLVCFCGIKYLNLNELESHQIESGHFSIALKLFSYKCVLCNLQEWSKKSFQNHINFHKSNSQTVTFVCSTCENSSVDLDDLLKMHNKSILCEVILAKIVDQNQMENTTNITTQDLLITINNDSNKMTQNVVKAKSITYGCKSCAFNTTEDRSFNDHLVYHVLQNERVVLACSCGIKYLNLIELESHQIESGHFSIALKLFSYKCVLCNLQEWSKKSFQNHINFHQIIGQTVTFVCSTCKKESFDLDELLKMHNKSILCEVILAKIVDQNQMENRTNITTQESLITINNDSNKMTQNVVKAKPIIYECKSCAFNTTEDRSFNDHLVYHVFQNDRVVLVCSCGTKYLNLNELKSHQTKSGHFSFSLKLFSYKCLLCNLQKWSKKSFQNHINFHKVNSQSVTFVCSTCKKESFDLDYLLEMHKKSILCDVLLAKIVDQSKTTTIQNFLKNKSIRYECKSCGFYTIQSKSFGDHIEYHILQNERVVLICKCGAKYLHLNELESHKNETGHCSFALELILGEIVDHNQIENLKSIPTRKTLPSTVVANVNLDDSDVQKNENIKFTCSCGLTFLNVDEFKIHQKVTLHFLLKVEPENLDDLETLPTVQKYLFKDLCCEFETDDEQSFRRHVFDHTTQNQTIFYTCSVQSCDFISNRLGDLKTHCHSETDNLCVICMDINMSFSYNCVSCDLNILDEDVFNDHVLEHTYKDDDLFYKCSTESCAFTSENIECLKRHMKSIAKHFGSNLVILEIKLFKCLSCLYETTNNAKYVAHQNFHTSVVAIENITMFNIQQKTKVHQSFVKKSLIYKCEFCEFQSNIVDHVNRHIFRHTSQKQVAYIYLNCHYCTKQFLSVNALQKYHQEDTSHIPSVVSVKVLVATGKENFLIQTFNLRSIAYYLCKGCVFETSQFNTFKEHVVFHKSENRNVILVCSCNLEFKDLNEFKDHRSKTGHNSLRIKPDHSLHRPNIKQFKPTSFECKQCAWKTCLFRDFKDHITFHIAQNERTLLTCVCGVKYLNLIELTIHEMKTGHDSGVVELISYKCGLCNIKITSKDAFQSHISQIHSNSVRFMCKTCNQSSLNLDDLLNIHTMSIRCDTIIAQEKSIEKEIEIDEFLKKNLEKDKEKTMENKISHTSLLHSFFTAAYDKNNLLITCNCKICDNGAQNLDFLSYLQLHTKQIENMKYVCICHEVYFNLQELKTHQKETGHSGITLETIDYICSTCDLEIKGIQNFKDHKANHGKQSIKYKYWCSFCNQDSLDLDSLLKMHIMSKRCDTIVLGTRVPFRVYNCRNCLYKTTQICRFKEHVKEHKNQKEIIKFACICYDKYPALTNILEHQKKHGHFSLTLESLRYICQPCNIYTKSQKSFEDHTRQCNPYKMKKLYFSCNGNCCGLSTNINFIISDFKKNKKCDTIIAQSIYEMGNARDKSTNTSSRLLAIDPPMAQQHLRNENEYLEQVNPVIIRIEDDEQLNLNPYKGVKLNPNSTFLNASANQNFTSDRSQVNKYDPSSIRPNSNIFIASDNQNANKEQSQVKVANTSANHSPLILNFDSFNFAATQNATNVRPQHDFADLNTNVNNSPLIVNFNHFNVRATQNATEIPPQDNITKLGVDANPSPLILNFNNFNSRFLQNSTIVRPQDNTNLSVNMNPSPLVINFDNANGYAQNTNTVRPQDNISTKKLNLFVNKQNIFNHSSSVLNSNPFTASTNENAFESEDDSAFINSLQYSKAPTAFSCSTNDSLAALTDQSLNGNERDIPYSSCNNHSMYIHSANVNTLPVQNNVNNPPIPNVMINSSINPQFNIIPNSTYVPTQHTSRTSDDSEVITIKSEPLTNSVSFSVSKKADIFAEGENCVFDSMYESIVKYEDC